MVRRHVAVAILLSLCVAASAQAQGIGSAIKKKVTQAANGSPTTAAQQSPAQSGSKLGFQLTDPVLQAFKNGLDAQIAGRQAYLKTIANLKTQDEYDQCAGYAMASPDAMALNEEYINRMDKATNPADMQKLMTWMSDSMKVLTTKACGPDPAPARNAQNDEFGKALDAGVAEFGKAFSGVNASDVRWWYSLLMEWILPFCGLSQQAQQNAAANGISINGSDASHQYVYTADEAKLLIKYCATLVPLIQAVE